MHLRVEAQRALILAALLAFVSPNALAQERPGAQTYKVGMTFRRFTPKEPYNWRGAQTHALTTVVWYPADASAVETPVQIPGLSNIFVLGNAAQNAKIAAAVAKFPLIVISHGTGGSALSMAWLGRGLAAHGYITAAVNHPGNNGAEPYTVEGFSIWWERARDLSEVINGMLVDDRLRSHIDAKRIAAAGFSLGGYTMIEIAGGVTDVQGFIRFCDSGKGDGICLSPPEFPTLVQDFRRFIREHPEELQQAGASYRDPRVRAVFAIAPALGPAFPADGLKKISIPVEILAGTADQNVPIQSSARYFAATIPGASLHIFRGKVAHYTFLDSCPESGKQVRPMLCIDAAGVDRDGKPEPVIFIQSWFEELYPT